MNKQSPPLLGFNNNVRYKGRLFHIQTEDSGIKYCRVVTHLFADGGRILRTSRTDYSAQLDASDFTERIRRLMKEQHRAMFAALRSGEIDEVIKSTFESPAAVSSGAPGVTTSEEPAPSPKDLPPLSLPATVRSDAVELATPASRLLRRPSNRPNRRSSRPPAARENRVPETPPAARGGASATSTSSSRLSLGRPPMDSSENTRYAPSRSIFGNTDTSEPSLGDVILSYVEESKEKGSGRA